MWSSILVPFALSRAIASNVGLKNEADKMVAFVMMVAVPNAAGVLLARQVALQRLPPPEAPKPSIDPAGAHKKQGA